MATIESNAVKKEDVSRETNEEKPVEVELPLETVEKTEEKPQEVAEEKAEKKKMKSLTSTVKTFKRELIKLLIVTEKNKEIKKKLLDLQRL